MPLFPRPRGSPTLPRFESFGRGKMDLDKAIDQLAAKGVLFHTSITSAGGSRTIGLSAAEVKAYARDPVAQISQNLGVTADVYLAWQQSEYMVRCAGKTQAGKPCKNTVPNGTLSPTLANGRSCRATTA